MSNVEVQEGIQKLNTIADRKKEEKEIKKATKNEGAG